MTICEEEEQPFDFHVVAIGEQLLQAVRAKIGESVYQLVDLMEALAFLQLVEKFENSSFRL
jgi:hypothetical protein